MRTHQDVAQELCNWANGYGTYSEMLAESSFTEDQFLTALNTQFGLGVVNNKFVVKHLNGTYVQEIVEGESNEV